MAEAVWPVVTTAAITIPTSTMEKFSFVPGVAPSDRFPAVDFPRRAETIDDYSVTQRPEGFLDGHLHLAVLRESLEDPFRFPASAISTIT